MKKLETEHSYFLFKLDDILAKKKVSINKVMKETNTDFKVIKRLINGDLVKLDMFVISRLCDYLECDFSDIIEYVPNKNINDSIIKNKQR